MVENREYLKVGLELLLWATFLVGALVTVPEVNWLAVRGAIVWVKRN